MSAGSRFNSLADSERISLFIHRQGSFFAFDEVGIIKLTAEVADDDYLGMLLTVLQAVYYLWIKSDAKVIQTLSTVFIVLMHILIHF